MTIDERLEALTMNLELMSHSHEALARKQAVDHEALARKQAKDHEKTENVLRRAIAASVKEARQEREKRRELDVRTAASSRELAEAMTELAASQQETKRMFQAWLKRGGNGKH